GQPPRQARKRARPRRFRRIGATTKSSVPRSRQAMPLSAPLSNRVSARGSNASTIRQDNDLGLECLVHADRHSGGHLREASGVGERLVERLTVLEERGEPVSPILLPHLPALPLELISQSIKSASKLH